MRSIDRDFDRAIDLLKSMPESERHRATVYMEGLAQMRKDIGRSRWVVSSRMIGGWINGTSAM